MQATSTASRRWFVVAVTCAFAVGLLAVAGGSAATTATENRTTVTHEVTVSLTGVPADGQARPVYVEVPNGAMGVLNVEATAAASDGLTLGSAEFVDGPDGDGVAETVAVDVSASGDGRVSGSVTLTVVGSYPGGDSLDPGSIVATGATGDAEFAADTDSPVVRTALSRANLSADAIPEDAAVAAVHTPAGTVVRDLSASVTADGGLTVPVSLERLDAVAAASVTPATIEFDPGGNDTAAVASTGDAPLSIRGVSLSGNATAFDLDAPAGPVPAGSTATVAVEHVGSGGEEATLTIRTNATDLPAATVDLVASVPTGEDETGEGDEAGEDDGGEGETVRTTVESAPGRTSVNVSVRNVSAGETVELSMPNVTATAAPSDRQSAAVTVRNLSMTARMAGDYNLSVSAGENVTESVAPLERNGTEPLGYFSVAESFEDDAISNASITVQVRKDRVAAMENTGPEEVALYRNPGDGWSEERTEFLGEHGGFYRYRVFAEGYSDWATAGKQPDFRIVETALNATSNVEVNESVGVTVRIRNDGAADGDYLTQLWLDDVVVADREVSIAAGGTGQVIFERTLRRTGTYEVRVNNVTVDQIAVNASGGMAAETAGAQTGGNADSDGTDGTDGNGLSTTVLGGALLLAVLAVVVAIVSIRRER